MADISKITLPNGKSYNFKDSEARNGLAGKAASSHTHNEYASKDKYGDITINVGRKSGTTVGHYSAAEGYNTTASGYQSHAEGNETTASGNGSHAEGSTTTASGNYSHAEGGRTTASGFCSHAGGHYTKALHDYEVAHGRYNISNSDTLLSIGDGTADDACHNAFEITATGGKLHDKDIAVKDDIPTISELIYTIRFSEITWNISGYGKCYYTIDIPATTQLISVNLGYWEEMSSDEFVQVTMPDRTHIQLISNTAKETGLLAIRISYI